MKKINLFFGIAFLAFTISCNKNDSLIVDEIKEGSSKNFQEYHSSRIRIFDKTEENFADVTISSYSEEIYNELLDFYDNAVLDIVYLDSIEEVEFVEYLEYELQTPEDTSHDTRINLDFSNPINNLLPDPAGRGITFVVRRKNPGTGNPPIGTLVLHPLPSNITVTLTNHPNSFTIQNYGVNANFLLVDIYNTQINIPISSGGSMSATPNSTFNSLFKVTGYNVNGNSIAAGLLCFYI